MKGSLTECSCAKWWNWGCYATTQIIPHNGLFWRWVHSNVMYYELQGYQSTYMMYPDVIMLEILVSSCTLLTLPISCFLYDTLGKYAILALPRPWIKPTLLWLHSTT